MNGHMNQDVEQFALTKNTCSTNKNVWNNVVENADDLRDILPCILNNKSKESSVQE